MTNEITTINDPKSMMAEINIKLPDIVEKSHFFRRDTQTSMSLQTITMLNGQSPMRMLRQIAAEIDQRRTTLLEAQLSFIKLQGKVDKATGIKKEILSIQLVEFQNAVQNSIKDIALFTTRYSQIEKTHGIDKWDEADFEKEEAKHHVRRGFELLYQNILQTGRPEKAIIEYLQQYGIHPQIAIREVIGYTQLVETRITNDEHDISANDLETFLDEMRDKYATNPELVAERIFGDKKLVVKSSMVPTIEGVQLSNKINVSLLEAPIK